MLVCVCVLQKKSKIRIDSCKIENDSLCGLMAGNEVTQDGAVCGGDISV